VAFEEPGFVEFDQHAVVVVELALELGAICIPAGSLVNLVPYVTQRDPR